MVPTHPSCTVPCALGDSLIQVGRAASSRGTRRTNLGTRRWPIALNAHRLRRKWQSGARKTAQRLGWTSSHSGGPQGKLTLRRHQCTVRHRSQPSISSESGPARATRKNAVEGERGGRCRGRDCHDGTHRLNMIASAPCPPAKTYTHVSDRSRWCLDCTRTRPSNNDPALPLPLRCTRALHV